MAQAPDLVPSQVPQGFAPEVSLPVPVDAFGGAVGKALEGLGGAIEGASDKIWSRAMEMQNLQNETQAKEADAQYMMQSGKMHADFINNEGLNAGPEALAKHIQDLQDKRTEIRAGLNPMAAKMYDASSLSFMGRNIFNAAGHSGQQMKVAANNASDSRIQLAKTSIGDNPDDEISVSRMTRVIESETDAKGRNSGWTPEQIAATKQSEVSEAVGHRILGIAKVNAPKAQRMLDDAIESKTLTPGVAEKITATVQNEFRTQGSRFIADKVLAGRRSGDEENRPVQEYVDAALEEAKKYNSKDPQFDDSVRSRVVTDYNRQRAIETDTDNSNTRTVGMAMLKANAEGSLPTSIEELKAIDPKVSPAWDELQRNPAKAQAVLKQLERNASGTHVLTTPENLQQFHTFRGQAMAGSDEERAGFMSKNFATESSLTITQRNGLMSLQDQMKHRAAISAADDPRTSRALRMLQPMLNDAKISAKGDTRDDYFSFVGSLQDQLDQFHKDHPGKLPSMEEVQTMGAQLMQQNVTSKGILWDTKEPIYKQAVPDEESKRIAADPYWAKRGITPNDFMISRIYRAEQFKERYGGAAKAPATAAFPPNAPEGSQ